METDGSLINTDDFADEGWDYNPGRYAWKPDPEKYPPEFRHLFQEGPLMEINSLDDLNEAFSRFYSDLFYHRIPDRVFEVDNSLSGLEARYSIDERKVRISRDMKDAILSSQSKLKGNVPLTIEEERAIKNLWHEIIHGQTPVYGVLPGWEHTVMETFVETLARTTYGRFIEYLGYPITRLSHTNTLLFDSYGRPEASELIRNLTNYESDFDLIIRALGETVRGYPEYKWFDVFKKKLEIIIGEDNAREVLNDVFML